MEILHINSNYLHSNLHSELVNHLKDLGLNNTVIMPRKINDEKHCVENIDDKNVFHKNFLTKADRFLYFRKQNKISQWINTLNIDIDNYDILHAHTLFSDGYIAYKLKKPYIVTVRNTDLNFYMKYYKHLKPIGRKILNHARAIIFLSQPYQIKTIKRLFKKQSEQNKILKKSVIIPNGINEFWVKNQKSTKKTLSKPIKVLCVARVMKNKNIDFLIKNLNEKNVHKKIHIYIIGGIQERTYYDHLKGYSNVTFLGQKDKYDIKKMMEDMNIFALTSFSETFGLVYLEALTQNLPLIYTRGEGFDGYFEPGCVGYAVSPTDERQLISSVKEIIHNYNAFQDRINLIDKNNFSWSEVARKHISLYQNEGL